MHVTSFITISEHMKKIALTILLNALFAMNSIAADWKPVSLSSKVTNVQPMTGLVLWTSEASDHYSAYGKCHALEYSYVAPCKVVKGCNADSSINYDWSYLEDLLDDIKSRNHQAVIRFFYEYPGEKMVDNEPGTSAVPAYIKARSDYHDVSKKVKGDGITH